MRRLESLSKRVVKQNENRQKWLCCEQSDEIAEMIRDEAEELVEAVQEAYLTGDPFTIASEMGDLMYLLLRLADLTGIDLLDATEVKLYRNSAKYFDELIDDHRDKKETAGIAKNVWEMMGGDKAFSHAYLEFIVDEDRE